MLKLRTTKLPSDHAPERTQPTAEVEATPSSNSGASSQPFTLPNPTTPVLSVPQHQSLLIVDDEPALLETLEVLFAGRYTVKTASSGEAGLQILAEGFRPQVILADQRMPSMSGAEFLAHSTQHAPKAVRVILTGYTDVTDIIDSINVGNVYRFLTKPWKNTELVEAIRLSFEHYNITTHNAELAQAMQELSRLNGELQQANAELVERRNQLEQAYMLLDYEKERSESLLLNILPFSVATKLKDGASIIADSISNATILFADLVGFTAYSASTSAEHLVDTLNKWFTLCDAAAERFGMEKIKTIGDNYMAASGLFGECSNCAEQTALFALRLMQLAEQFRQTTGQPWHLRIGLHSGAVTAGVIGKKKFVYDVWGDTVNIASRMESRGEAGRIHCSETVYKQLSEKFVLEERGSIDIKGKGLMNTYFLLGKRDNSPDIEAL
jgi:adenylate cyclase